MNGLQTSMVKATEFGSLPMDYVEHTCVRSGCNQVTRVALRNVHEGVWLPLGRGELKATFPAEISIRGVGHNNEGITYWVDVARAGPHRMARCGCCFTSWSIDEALGVDGPWWLTPISRE